MSPCCEGRQQRIDIYNDDNLWCPLKIASSLLNLSIKGRESLGPSVPPQTCDGDYGLP